MPLYDYECRSCHATFDEYRPMAESSFDAECPDCGGAAGKQVSAPAIKADIYSWSNENGGKGRRISQLDHGIDKPYYAKSQQCAIDEASSRGLHATKTR